MTYPVRVPPVFPTSLPYYDSRSTPPPPFSPICLLAYKDTCPKYSPIKLSFARAWSIHYRCPQRSSREASKEAPETLSGPRQVLTRAIVKTRFVLIPLLGLFFVVVANNRLSISPPWLAEGGFIMKALGGAPDSWEGGGECFLLIGPA